MSYTQWSKLYMIKFANSHQHALKDHNNVYKNASASETMQNAKNVQCICTFQLPNLENKKKSKQDLQS